MFTLRSELLGLGIFTREGKEARLLETLDEDVPESRRRREWTSLLGQRGKAIVILDDGESALPTRT